MRCLHTVLMMSTALMAVACSPEPEARVNAPLKAPLEDQADVVTLTCDSGAEVSIAYLESDLIRLTYKNRSYSLSRNAAGQGVFYSGDGVSWSSVEQDGQDVGTLSHIELNSGTAPAALEQCRRPVSSLAARPVSMGLDPCISPDLTFAVESGDAGMGHRLATIGMQNIGTKACQLMGYPRVSLENSEGQALAQVKAVNQTSGYFTTTKAAVPIMLKPRERASFDLGWGVVPHEGDGEKTCPQGATVKIAPPGDTGGKSLPLAITACGGKIEVSPFRPGQAAPKPSTPAA